MVYVTQFVSFFMNDFETVKNAVNLLDVICTETGLKVKGKHLEECPFCGGGGGVCCLGGVFFFFLLFWEGGGGCFLGGGGWVLKKEYP